MRANAAVLMMAVGLGLTVAAKASDDPGARRLGREYRCYRSFLKQPERTADFAKLGITTRCVFAANTVNSLGTPYCEYPPIWTGFGKTDYKPYCPPGPTRFEASFEGVVYDPVKDAEKVDYWRFHNGIVADAILHFAKEARTLLPRGGKKEIGVFFGYYFDHNFRQVSFGHLVSGRTVAEGTDTFTDDFTAPDTKIYAVDLRVPVPALAACRTENHNATRWGK